MTATYGRQAVMAAILAALAGLLLLLLLITDSQSQVALHSIPEAVLNLTYADPSPINRNSLGSGA